MIEFCKKIYAFILNKIKAMVKKAQYEDSILIRQEFLDLFLKEILNTKMEYLKGYFMDSKPEKQDGYEKVTFKIASRYLYIECDIQENHKDHTYPCVTFKTFEKVWQTLRIAKLSAGSAKEINTYHIAELDFGININKKIIGKLSDGLPYANLAYTVESKMKDLIETYSTKMEGYIDSLYETHTN